MTPIRVLREAWNRFARDDATLLAAAISYFVFLSIGPLLVATILALTWIVGPEQALAAVLALAEPALGPQGSDAVRQLLDSTTVEVDTGWLALGSLVIAIFGGSRAFLHIQTALNRVWDVPDAAYDNLRRHVTRLVRKRALSLVLVAALAGITIGSVVLDTIAGLAMGAASHWVGPVPGMVRLTQILVSFFLLSVIFTLSYRVLPDVKVTWSDGFVGATVAAGLVTVAARLMSGYLTHVAASSVSAAAATIVITMLWLHVTALVFLFGAEITSARASIRGRPIEPEIPKG